MNLGIFRKSSIQKIKLKVLSSENLDSLLKRCSVSESYDDQNTWYAHKRQRRIMGDKHYISAHITNSDVSLLAEVTKDTYDLLYSFLKTDVSLDEIDGSLDRIRQYLTMKYKVDYPAISHNAVSDAKCFLDAVERLNREYCTHSIKKGYYTG